MSTGNAQHPLALQYMLGQPLRTGYILQSPVQDRFDLRIASRHGIADDNQIRIAIQVFWLIAMHQFDALFFQLGAHRRINILVRTADLIPQLSGDQCQPPHEGAANTENMYMDGLFLTAHCFVLPDFLL